MSAKLKRQYLTLRHMQAETKRLQNEKVNLNDTLEKRRVEVEGKQKALSDLEQQHLVLRHDMQVLLNIIKMLETEYPPISSENKKEESFEQSSESDVLNSEISIDLLNDYIIKAVHHLVDANSTEELQTVDSFMKQKQKHEKK